MARPTTPSFYEVFGGLNTESGSEISQYEARDLQNLYIQNRGQELVRRKGTDILRDWEEIALIDGLEWVRIDGTDHLLTVFSGDIYDALSGPAVVSGGSDRFPSSADVNGALLSSKLYLGNGVDQNVRWDGDAIKQVMPAQPGSGTVAATGAVGLLTGTYNYRITFTSADGINSQPSEPTTIAVNTKKVDLSSIPTASSTENTQGRKVWRTAAGGTTYYLITTLADNTTTTYTDNTADADLDTTVELDLETVRFPPCRYLVNHQERLVGAFSSGSAGDQKTVYISNYQEPENCPLIAPLDEVDNPVFGARIPVEDTVTALATFGNVLLVWTAGGCWRLIGDNPNNWSFDKWIDNGCVAHRTAASHRNTLLWLGPDGVYQAEGWGQVTRISDPIRAEFEDEITAPFMENAHAFIWQDRYYLCFIDRAFYYDLTYRTWGELTSWDWLNTAVSRNTGETKERIFAADDLSAQVWELETGTDDDGDAIQVRWTSKDKDLGHFGREKRVHRVVVAFKTGTGEATVKLYRSGELLDTFTHDLSDVTRTGSEISVLDERTSEGARDEYFRLLIESETEAEAFRLLRAGFHYTLVT